MDYMDQHHGTVLQSSFETVSDARDLFRSEGLPFPPLPPAFATRLQRVNDRVFATRKTDVMPYTLELYSSELFGQTRVDDYALIGLDGYGVNSWAVHYYLVSGPLALFVQIPWGGAYTDAESAVQNIETIFAWADALQKRVAQLDARGAIPFGWRLWIVESRFNPMGWQWLPPSEKRPETRRILLPLQGKNLRKAVDDTLNDVAMGTLRL